MDYKLVDESQFMELDIYLRGRLHTTFGKNIDKRLFRYSFQNSIKHGKINLYHKFDNNEFIARICAIDLKINRLKLFKMNRQELEMTYRKILNI